MNVSQKILNWFHFHGRKNLPWQINKTSYSVWLSEIMLQQTKVNTVIPYFLKFLKKYPDIKTLSLSSIDEILHIWSGLGYYTRAKNVLKTAKIIYKNYENKFPDRFNVLIKLPGIGRTTAGAILSISFNYYFPILDGNVKRILIRFYGILYEKYNKKIENILWKKIQSILPLHNSGKFNQAMMDLGSLICLPKLPICTKCPINKKCIFFNNNPISINYKKKKKLQLKKYWCIIIIYKHYAFLKKCNKEKFWKDLFCFPMFSTKKTLFNWKKKNKIQSYQSKQIKPIYIYVTKYKIKIHSIVFKTKTNINNVVKNNYMSFNFLYQQEIGVPSLVPKILKNYMC